MKYLLLDTHNLFHRAKHVTSGDIDMRVGMSLQIVLNSILKSWQLVGADHLVIALEGKSWRKSVYAEYKMHREVKDKLKTPREKRDDEALQAAMNDLIDLLKNHTNCTILQSEALEADDMIALWIQSHTEDQHVIVSSDTDFYQLLSENTSIYNGIKGHMIRIDGVTDVTNGEVVYDKKTNQPLVIDPEWELFRKCMKGDSSDGIWAAHVPRTRETKIKAAFNDRHTRGYDWTNLVMEEWEDHNKEKLSVLERYERNVELIDLSAQPDIIRDFGMDAISEAKKKPRCNDIGISFMRFCNKYALIRISEKADQFGRMFVKGLPTND